MVINKTQESIISKSRWVILAGAIALGLTATMLISQKGITPASLSVAIFAAILALAFAAFSFGDKIPSSKKFDKAIGVSSDDGAGLAGSKTADGDKFFKYLFDAGAKIKKGAGVDFNPFEEGVKYFFAKPKEGEPHHINFETISKDALSKKIKEILMPPFFKIATEIKRQGRDGRNPKNEFISGLATTETKNISAVSNFLADTIKQWVAKNKSLDISDLFTEAGKKDEKKMDFKDFFEERRDKQTSTFALIGGSVALAVVAPIVLTQVFDYYKIGLGTSEPIVGAASVLLLLVGVLSWSISNWKKEAKQYDRMPDPKDLNVTRVQKIMRTEAREPREGAPTPLEHQ